LAQKVLVVWPYRSLPMVGLGSLGLGRCLPSQQQQQQLLFGQYHRRGLQLTSSQLALSRLVVAVNILVRAGCQGAVHTDCQVKASDERRPQLAHTSPSVVVSSVAFDYQKICSSSQQLQCLGHWAKQWRTF
jgi:hypothetical protein